MAVFQYNSLIIPYRIELAPFEYDLALLQGSGFTQDYWRPILEHLATQAPAGGRVMTCDWHRPGTTPVESAESLVRLVQTLGLQRLHVMACDEAVAIAQEADRSHPGLFAKTLYFAHSGPKGDELIRAVSGFCGL